MHLVEVMLTVRCGILVQSSNIEVLYLSIIYMLVTLHNIKLNRTDSKPISTQAFLLAHAQVNSIVAFTYIIAARFEP